MLEDQYLTFEFSGGIDQKTATRHVVGPKLTALVNGCFDKSGRINKRFGYSAIPRSILPSGTLASCSWISGWRKELLLSDGHALYSAAPFRAGWILRDKLPELTASRTQVSSLAAATSSFVASLQPSSITDPDVATINGFAVHVWIQSNATGFELRSTVIDVATGTAILVSALVDSTAALCPRLVTAGSKVACLWPDTTGKIYIAQLDATSASTVAAGWNYFGVGSSSSPVTLVSDALVTTKPQFDVCSAVSSFYLAYNCNAPATPIRVKLYPTPGASVPTPTATASSVDLAGVSSQIVIACTMNSTLSRILLAYTTISPGFLQARETDFAANLSSEGTPRALFSLIDIQNAQSVAVVASSPTAAKAMVTTTQAPVTTYFKSFDISTGPAAGVPGSAYHTYLATKPAQVSGMTVVGLYSCAFGATTPSLQSSFVVAEVIDSTTRNTAVRPLCLVAPNLASPAFATAGLTAPTPVPSLTFSSTAQVWVTSCITLRSAAGARGADHVSIFATPPMSQAVETYGAAIVPCGWPMAYSGGTVAEAAILHYPERIAINQSSAGGLIANGTYQYSCCYAYQNSLGETVRSAPSPSQQISVTGVNNTVTLVVDTLQLSKAQDLLVGVPNQQRPVVVEVYRSQAGGTTMQLVGSVANDVTSPNVTFVDKLPDAAIASDPFLYTAGGTIPNASPPSSTIACMHKGRLFLSGCDDGRQIWFSRTIVAGEPVSWNQSNVIVIGDGGSITGLASMDDNLVIFKRDKIFVLPGQGPNDAGLSSDYGVPTRIAADLGCIEPRSIVLGPMGIMFLSAAGIYILTRQLEVMFIGEDVKDVTAQKLITSSAVVHPFQSHIRFSCADGLDSAGNVGVSPVYDYSRGQWTTFTFFEPISGNSATPVVSACVVGGSYYWAASNGAVMAESTSYDDAGTWVTLSVTSPWIQVGRMSGYQRARRVTVLGESMSQHDLAMTIETDFGTTSQSVSWRSDVVAAMGVENVVAHVRNQKSSAIRITVSDAQPSGPGAPAGGGPGVALDALGVTIAVKRGTNKVSSAQRR